VALEVDLAKRTREIHKANAELAVLNRRLERMAATDELTGLANRREAMARLAEHWATAERYHQPYACALLDLDEFKCFNDTCGHNVGDLVLREVSGTLIANSRNGDTISRFGGEEFLVLCPNTTAELALETAQDLRRAVQATKIQWRDRELTVTLSAGVAERDATTRTLYDLLNKADAALYAAKDAGRNRVCVAGPETAGAASRKEPSGLPWVPA